MAHETLPERRACGVRAQGLGAGGGSPGPHGAQRRRVGDTRPQGAEGDEPLRPRGR